MGKAKFQTLNTAVGDYSTQEAQFLHSNCSAVFKVPTCAAAQVLMMHKPIENKEEVNYSEISEVECV